MTPQQFLSQIKTEPAPMYLFIGPEMYRRRICRKMLLDKFLPDDMREEGFTRHDLDETSLRDVVDDVSSLSLFAPQRLVWASGAEAVLPRGNSPDAEKAAAALVSSYAANPVPGVILVFDSARLTFDNDDKTKMERLRKIFASIPNQVEFAPYTESEARKLAADLAQRGKLRIHPAALDALVESLGNDAARLASEIEKLSLYTNGEREVTEADIATLAPDARTTTIFALVNAMGAADRAASLDLLDRLVREGEYLPMALTFLSTQFRLALAAKEEGLRSQQQIQGHFQKLGIGMWPSRAMQVLTTMNAFTKQKLEQAVAKLYVADKGFRDRSPDDRIVMEDLVISLTR
jgi:DNA polymerase-3 subunit delta